MKAKFTLKNKVFSILLNIGISILTSFIAFIIFALTTTKTVNKTYKLVKEIHEAVINKNTIYHE